MNTDQQVVLDTNTQLSARETYECGKKKLIDKVKNTQILYNQCIQDFCSYGNLNYSDTVIKGIPAFFRHYDAKFNPMNTIITMDYPVLKRIEELSGADAIAEYVQCIFLEQLFLGKLPQKYVYSTLGSYHEDYEHLYCNICNIVLREMLISLLCGIRPGNEVPHTKKKELQNKVASDHNRKELIKQLISLISQIVDQFYDGNEALSQYLAYDVEDFAVELLYLQ